MVLEDEFAKAKRLIIGTYIIYGIVILSIIVFLGWVIIKFMQHWGVI